MSAHVSTGTGRPKVAYDSLDEARQRAGVDENAYQCPVCDKFHVGHLQGLSMRQLLDPSAGARAECAMNRPIPWRGEPAPAGFHFEAVVDDDWRLTVDACRKCRGGKRCPREVVAELRRRAYLYQSKKHVDRWYGYCDEHLYGNWIEDGQVMQWKLRADSEAAS